MTGVPRAGAGLAERPLKGSLKRVDDALTAAGLDVEILRFAESTRTAEEAAAAVGCKVAQIVKSLMFRGADSDRPVLVIASGANRVDTARVAALIGESVARADAAYVRARTGFAIGGVAPVGHKEPPVTVIDRALLGFSEIWAAAGAPDAVFRMDPQDLPALTSGIVGEVGAE